jgi:hypothetical protein
MTSAEKETLPKETQPETDIPPVLVKIWGVISEFKFVILIAFLAFWVKVAYTSSIDMWDEGWYAAIFSHMAEGTFTSDIQLPLYYPAEGGNVKFFDKPPVAFWGGAILMNIFGRSTFAAKGVIIIGGAGLAVIIYYLFSHQSENKSAAIIAGLLVALANFLTFYSRTAYIDPFVIFMSALVMVLAVRMIDAVFVENNMKKGYLLLIITAIVNVFNILTKAWQGVLTFPAIAIYLLIRYLERHIRQEDLKSVWEEVRSYFTLSPQKIPPYLFFTRVGLPSPFVISIISFGCAFLGSLIITNLFASSVILALVSAIGSYIVILRTSNIQEKILLLPGIVSGIIGGLLSGVSGGFIIKIFYERMAGSFIEIAQGFGDEEVFSPGTFPGILEELLSNDNLALFLLELLSSIFGSIITFLVIFLLTGFILDLLTHNKKFIRIFVDILDIIPLAILGLWFAFWFAAILLLGLIFERDAYKITLFGVGISLILTLVVTSFPTIKNYFLNLVNMKSQLRSKEEQATFESHLLFTCIAIILLILSFIPFVSWVQYLDVNIGNGTFPWVIRTPGELRNPPDVVTYTFLFFEYYISWRYTHGTKYSLPSSIGSAVNDYLLLVLLPFFIIGIVAFFFSDKRNIALGSLFLTWLVTVPFIFFPAQFQLNYYYIPLAIPYLAVAAKGIEYIYSSERWRITVADNIERFLAGGYFYLEISYTYLLLPVLSFSAPLIDFIRGNIDLDSFMINVDILTKYFFIACIFLVPFTLLAFRVLKTFPGIITLGFAYKFFISSWVKDFDKLYNLIFHDLLNTILTLDYSWIQDIFELGAPLVTLVGLICLVFGLYWLKDRVKPQAFVILILAFSGMLIQVSTLAHYNQILDMGFQEMGIYIKNHGGDYNDSTWVIPEAGAQFAMRYYLGYEVLDTGNTPFGSEYHNSTSAVDTYFRSRPNVRFWAVINHTGHWWDPETKRGVPPYAEMYPESYRWLTTNENLACVDDIIGLTSWYKIHLFVNRTWISEQGYDWTKITG